MDPENREHFLELIKTCDVFIENNVPETLVRMGIDYETLREVNPDIIVVRMPAYGLSGPYSAWRSFGPHVAGLIWHQFTRSYPDGDPNKAGEVSSATAAAGPMASQFTILALPH